MYHSHMIGYDEACDITTDFIDFMERQASQDGYEEEWRSLVALESSGARGENGRCFAKGGAGGTLVDEDEGRMTEELQSTLCQLRDEMHGKRYREEDLQGKKEPREWQEVVSRIGADGNLDE